MSDSLDHNLHEQLQGELQFEPTTIALVYSIQIGL